MTNTTATHSPVNIEQRKKLNIRAGDTVRVSVRIQEKGKTRLQHFEGIVLARKHGNEPGATFTVRRTTGGIGVEKVFPLFSPVIDKITIVKRAKVRQANLYHIRTKATKEVRRYMKNVRIVSETDEGQEVEEGNTEESSVAEEDGSTEDTAEEEAAEKNEEEKTSDEEVKEETGSEESDDVASKEEDEAKAL